ncbi:MAG: alpha/beta fold hydrolase [Anaerolineae bacterium]|nr:alpha/beta fold hydrolase [Anaerolineae bacterium]
MPYIALPTGRVWYAAHTAKHAPQGRPPLMLVHGAGGSHLDWPGELRQPHHIGIIDTLALDLPGHGRSDPPGRDTIDAYADDVRALLDALGVPRAVLCGHSMGGAVCQALALRWPARVAALILIATGARLRVAPALLEAVQAGDASAYDAIVQGLWPPGAARERGRARLAQTPIEVLRGDLLACDAFDLMDRVQHITAPALVIGGSADPMTPLKFGRYLAEHIPGAERVVIEGAGHMVALEQPARVAAAVRSFLERVL